MHTVEELLGDTSATQVTHQVMKNCDVRDPRLDLSSLQSSRVSSHAVCRKTASEEALGHTCSYACTTVASLSVCSLICCSISTSDRAHFRILLTLKGEDPSLAHPQEIITTPCKAKVFATGNQGSSGVATYQDLLYAATQAGWTHRSPASSRNLKPKRVSCNLADNYYTLV